MRYIVVLILAMSAGSAWAETLFDGSTPKAARASIHAMGQEADGRVRGKTFDALHAAVQKIDRSIEPKYRPVAGQPYDPVKSNAAKQAEFNQLLGGKTTEQVLAMAARLP